MLTPESEATARVLYDEPLGFDPKVHTPPFLRQAFLKVKTAATVSLLSSENMLAGVVAFLRSLALTYQTVHWQAPLYSDHLLFERLYDSTFEEVDGVGERVVGLAGETHVDLGPQTNLIATVTLFVDEFLKQGANPASVCLTLERYLLNLVSQVSASKPDPGTSNLLEGIADNHMKHVYLLQQRCKPVLVSKTPRWR